MSQKERRVRFNLYRLMKELETAKGRDYSWSDVSRLAGLHLNTVLDAAHNRTRQVRFDTLEKLLAFLRAEGMDVSLDDLLIEAEVEVDDAHAAPL